jgi:hypothetical protein
MGKKLGAAFLFSWIIIEAFAPISVGIFREHREVHVVEGRSILTRTFGPLDKFLAN